MAKPSPPPLSIIGAGKVGSALGLALAEKGYKTVSIISRQGKDALALAKAVKCKRASTQIKDIAPETELILIAVSDGEIVNVAKELAATKQLKFKKTFAFHTSGVLSSDALRPIEKKGSLVASVHPIQTFPNGQSIQHLRAKLKGICYGIECDDDALVNVERLVKDLDGRFVVIEKELKSLYHVACVFSSSYLMILMNAISEMSSKLHLKASWTEIFGPLMTTSMENTIKHTAADTLTGPIVRNDRATIDIHLETLRQYAPELLPLYTVAGIEVARVAKQYRKLDQQQYDELVMRFKDFIRSTSFNTKQKVKR